METTVICVDNSEWTRNGDYAPCRFQAQVDAVNLLAGSKTEANAENTVGILLMAGDGPRILTTPTTDLGKILTSMQVKSFRIILCHAVLLNVGAVALSLALSRFYLITNIYSRFYNI